MNNQIKILLTINGISGGVLHISNRAKVPFVLTKADIHFQNTGKFYKGKDGNKIVRRGVRKYYEYEVVPCTKSIKLTYDAYEYMTSTEMPSWYHKKDWRRLTPIKRLELHLQRTCDANGGTSFTYSILED
jgi:hypothetical protein